MLFIDAVNVSEVTLMEIVSREAAQSQESALATGE